MNVTNTGVNSDFEAHVMQVKENTEKWVGVDLKKLLFETLIVKVSLF